MKIKSLLIPLFSLIVCLSILFVWTAGFSSFTVFSYTLKKANPIGKPFPDIQLINQDSLVYNIKNKDKFKLVNFVYLNCPFVCHKVNNQLEEIYYMLDSMEVPSKIEFTTISFDPKHDNIQKIRNYRNHFGDKISGWDFTLPHHIGEDEFQKFLQEIGVWIHKESANGIINHSTNLYLVSPDNKIVHVFDPNRESNSFIAKGIQQCLHENQLVSL